MPKRKPNTAKSIGAKALTVVDMDSNLPPAKVERIDLSGSKQIARELCRLYKSAKGGDIEINKATKLVYILSVAAKVVESAEMIDRIEKLEAEYRNV